VGAPKLPGGQAPLADLRLRAKQTVLYIFDFGDQHEFEVQLVATNPDAPAARYPLIAETHGDNPPQSGGFEGDDAGNWDDAELDADEFEADEAVDGADEDEA